MCVEGEGAEDGEQVQAGQLLLLPPRLLINRYESVEVALKVVILVLDGS